MHPKTITKDKIFFESFESNQIQIAFERSFSYFFPIISIRARSSLLS